MFQSEPSSDALTTTALGSTARVPAETGETGGRVALPGPGSGRPSAPHTPASASALITTTATRTTRDTRRLPRPWRGRTRCVGRRTGVAAGTTAGGAGGWSGSVL